MDFLKRHYEKIILAILLITFVALLVYLIGIISSTAEVSPESLKIPTPVPDHVNVDFDSPDFGVDNLFTRDMYWLEALPREEKSRYFTDLLLAIRSARCPHCKKIVPEFYFLNQPHKCLFCDGDLPAPPDDATAPVVDQSLVDTDGDGIPDMIEKRFGLNPNDPNDAHRDMDGDGFTNLFEYQQGTDMSDPQSHPPLHLRLQVVEIRREQLPVILQRVSAISQQKEHWDIQINSIRDGRSRFHLLGDILQMGSKEYKIIDVIPKYKTSEVTSNVAVTVDESEIVIQSQDQNQDKITMKVGQPAFSPHPIAVVRDVHTLQEYRLGEGQRFAVGGDPTDVFQYQVKRIDPANTRVLLDDGGESKGEIWVTRERRIPPVVTDAGVRPATMPEDGAPFRGFDPALPPGVPQLPDF